MRPTTLGRGGLLFLLTTIKLILNTAYRFVYPFLPALGRGLGVDLAAMGRLLSVRWTVGLSLPLAAEAVDRGGRSRRLLVVGLIVFGLGSIVTAATGVMVGAVIGFALMGLGKPLLDVGTQAYVSERVPYRARARSLGVLELSWAGGLLVGAPVTGWLIDSWDWTLPFWMLGSLALISVGAVTLLLEPADGAGREAMSGRDQPLSLIVPFLVVAVIVGFASEIVFIVLGAWLENSFAMTLFGLATVGSLLGVAELTGEGVMVAFTDRIGKRNSYALGLGSAAVALAGLAVVSDSLFLGVAFLFGVVICFEFSVISGMTLASELRPTRRARFLSIGLVASGLGRVIGDLSGPGIFGAGGMTLIALVAGGSAALGAVLLITTVSEIVSAETEVTPLH